MELWSRPVLREEEEEERRVDWIELFLDLAFVALVSNLASGLSRHIGLDGFGRYSVLFAAMWVVWRYGAIYADRFETDDLSYRASLLALMAAVVVMAVGAGKSVASGFRVYGIAYAGASTIVMSLWLRGGRHNPRFRRLAGQLTVFHAISITFWLLAVVVGTPNGWWLGAVALCVDLSAPLVTARGQDQLPKLSATHLPERFGLFTIIVLGEAVFATAFGISHAARLSSLTWAAGACALLLFTGLYWLYFDQVMSGEPPATALRRNLTQYVHLPLTMSIAGVSAIVPELVDSPGSPLSTSSRLLLCGGLAFALLSIAVLEAATIREMGAECLLHESRILEIIGAGALAVASLAIPSAPAIVFAVIATLIIIAIIARSAVVRARGYCNI